MQTTAMNPNQYPWVATTRSIHNMSSNHRKYVILSQTKLYGHQLISILNNPTIGFQSYDNIGYH